MFKHDDALYIPLTGDQVRLAQQLKRDGSMAYTVRRSLVPWGDTFLQENQRSSVEHHLHASEKGSNLMLRPCQNLVLLTQRPSIEFNASHLIEISLFLIVSFVHTLQH